VEIHTITGNAMMYFVVVKILVIAYVVAIQIEKIIMVQIIIIETYVAVVGKTCTGHVVGDVIMIDKLVGCSVAGKKARVVVLQ